MAIAGPGPRFAAARASLDVAGCAALALCARRLRRLAPRRTASRTAARRPRRRPRRADPPSGSPRTTPTCCGLRPRARRAAAAPFLAARTSLTALHPRYLRLIVDWAALQPSAQAAPALAASASGCAREVGPCGAYAGLTGELEAIAAQQRVARAEGRPAFEVGRRHPRRTGLGGAARTRLRGPGDARLGATDRAVGARRLPRADRAAARARPARGRRAARGGARGTSRTTRASSSPQRERATPNGPPAAPAVYAQLAEAMSAELEAAGARRSDAARRARRLRLRLGAPPRRSASSCGRCRRACCA